MAYSELIKNFERIRDYMREFYIYGFKSREELTDAVVDLYEKQIIPAVSKGLSASVYTQLSDVEDELNGLVTYDRKVVKMDKEKIKAMSDKLLGK